MASNYIGGGVATPVVDSTQPHHTIAEVPPPITLLQPPSSNPGSDDPTGGIPKEAGGLSSTAGIGSPVRNEQQTVVGAVLESVFGKKERTAEEVEALAPTTSTVTTSEKTSTSPGVLGAIVGAATTGGVAVASIIPGMSTTAAETQAAPSSTRDTVGAETNPPAESTTAETIEATKQSVGAEGAEAKQPSAGAEKAAATEHEEESTTAETVEATKQSVGAEKVETTAHEEDPQAAEAAKKKADHAAAVRENKDAIPTAGGEKLGSAHEGESKVIPDNPKPVESDVGVSSAVGQPDALTAENTAKNTGDADPSQAPKGKFSDRLKKTLHIGNKKDQA